MTGRPRLLDLFCGAGGAGMGYHRAGFDVVGVDIKPQPRYPFEFHQADALAFPLDGFDAIHASPPCQHYTIAQNASKNADAHPDLVPPVRALLAEAGCPYVIENVMGAPMPNAVVLCGTSFGLRHDGFELRRHRQFECSFPVMVPPCYHELPAAPVFGHNAGRDFIRRYGRGYNAAAKAAVMGIDWMTRDEVSESIPPAMTEHIGGYLLNAIRSADAVPSAPAGTDECPVHGRPPDGLQACDRCERSLWPTVAAIPSAPPGILSRT